MGSKFVSDLLLSLLDPNLSWNGRYTCSALVIGFDKCEFSQFFYGRLS